MEVKKMSQKAQEVTAGLRLQCAHVPLWKCVQHEYMRVYRWIASSGVSIYSTLCVHWSLRAFSMADLPQSQWGQQAGSSWAMTQILGRGRGLRWLIESKINGLSIFETPVIEIQKTGLIGEAQYKLKAKKKREWEEVQKTDTSSRLRTLIIYCDGIKQNKLATYIFPPRR